MMGIFIEESGMTFGEFNEDEVFHIEKSEQYIKGLLSNGIKSCEFILQRKNRLYFIEAKSSCPRTPQRNILPDQPLDRKKKYDEFIEDIVLKMRHSLSLYCSILLNRFPQTGIPNPMKRPDLKDKDIYFILVINTNGAWYPDQELEDDLNNHLDDILKIWKITRLFVINDSDARKKKFII